MCKGQVSGCVPQSFLFSFSRQPKSKGVLHCFLCFLVQEVAFFQRYVNMLQEPGTANESPTTYFSRIDVTFNDTHLLLVFQVRVAQHFALMHTFQV